MTRTVIHRALILAFAAAVGVARFTIPSRPLSLAGSYEAMAHVFVGGLIGAWLVGRRPLYLWAAVAITAAEVLGFIIL